MEEDGHIPRYVLYCTPEIRREDLDPKYIKNEMLISPCDSDKWEFSDVLLFLNCMRDFVPSDRVRYYHGPQSSYFTMSFSKEKSPDVVFY